MTDCDPLVDLEPDQATLAVHEVASVVDQVIVVELPKFMVVGLAEIERVGAGGFTVTVAEAEAEPPGPVQVKV